MCLFIFDCLSGNRCQNCVISERSVKYILSIIISLKSSLTICHFVTSHNSSTLSAKQFNLFLICRDAIYYWSLWDSVIIVSYDSNCPEHHTSIHFLNGNKVTMMNIYISITFRNVDQKREQSILLLARTKYNATDRLLNYFNLIT